MAAAVGEVLARCDGNEALPCVATIRNAELSARRHAFKVSLEDEVDDAGDAVGAIDRRRTAGQHVDAIDKVGRAAVDVDRRRVRLAGDVTSPVDQHERTLHAKIA